jgi:putative glycosyltransferase (TIGR04372 family)
MLNNIIKLQSSMQDYTDIQNQIINTNGLSGLNIRIIKDNIFEYYNVHAYLDTHVKAMLLGLQPNYNLVLLLRPGMVIQNPVMMEYWKKYITIIDDKKTIELLNPLRQYLEIDIGMAVNLNHQAIYIEHAKGTVQKEWEKQGREPLMQLSQEDITYGWGELLELGIHEGAWFICLHVRDAGYKTGSYTSDYELDSYRNADIDTYDLLIDEVIDRGGYVIRVGDPNMKPVKPKEGLYDYALSDIRSNRMDIFLFSQCRFFVGVSSGPVLTPTLFGVPVVMTNFAPLAGRPHAGNCLYLPKLYWLKDEDRYVTFLDALSSDISRVYTIDGYEKKNINVIDNTGEELKEVVTEMLQTLDESIDYSTDDERRQNIVTKLYKEYSGYGDMGRIGNAYIEKCEQQGLI